MYMYVRTNIHVRTLVPVRGRRVHVVCPSAPLVPGGEGWVGEGVMVKCGVVVVRAKVRVEAVVLIKVMWCILDA